MDGHDREPEADRWAGEAGDARVRRGRDGPGEASWTWELAAFDPAREVSFRTISKNALGMDGTYRLAPRGPDATQVDAVVEIRTRGLLRLLEPLFRGEMTRNESGELDRLKSLLEGTATSVSERPAP